MNTMIRPICTTFLMALLHHFDGSIALKELHTCQVLSIPRETATQQHMTLIKFDVIHLTSTDVISTSNSATYPTSGLPTSNNYSTTTTEPPSNTFPENTTVLSTSISKNENMTYVYTAQTTMTVPVVPVEGRMPTHCHCQVESITTTNILVRNVLSTTQDGSLLLHVDNGLGKNESFVVNETWSHSFNDKSMNLSLATQNNESKLYDSLIIEVRGNFSVTCREYVAVLVNGKTKDGVMVGRTNTVIKANSELFFETPLLVVGGVMAVMGLLFISVAISMMRRHRKRGRKQATEKKEIELVDFPQSNYEVISKGSSEHSSTEIQDSSRKASVSSTTKMKHKQENTSHSMPQFLNVNESPGTHARDQKPSPSTTRYMRMRFGRRKKKQELRMSKEKKERSKNVANDEDETYSSVQQEIYEDSREIPQSPTKRDIRVATPLLLVLSSGSQPSPLRKTENLTEAQAKARSMPKMKHSESPTESAYCHFDRTKKSQSYHMRHTATVDDDITYSTADDVVRCKSIDAVRKSFNLFNVPKLKSYEQKGVTTMPKEDNERDTSISSNQEEQDHIYEAVEKLEKTSVYGKEASQSDNYFTEEPNEETANSQTEDLVKREQRNNQETICSVSQSEPEVNEDDYDTVEEYETTGTESVPLCDDAVPPDITATTNGGVDKMELQNVEEARADDKREISSVLDEKQRVSVALCEESRLSSVLEGKRRLPVVNDILTNNKSPDTDEQNGRNVHNHPNEVQGDLMNYTRSSANHDLCNASAGDNVLSDQTLEAAEAEPTTSQSGTNEDEEDSHKEMGVDNYSEEFIITDNIVYESSLSLQHQFSQPMSFKTTLL